MTEIALRERVQGVHHLVQRHWNGRFAEVWSYRYTNEVPLRSGEEAVTVNWCELSMSHADTGELLYHNAFVTNHLISEQRVPPSVRCGRARWKTENENHNTLKNHGYHLTHNFGHGQQFLAAFLLTLNLLAFLLHTVLQLTDDAYQHLRSALGARKTFFDDLRTLTPYFLFDSWHHLLSFMLAGLQLPASPSPSTENC